MAAVAQPTINPTNKLTASVIAVALMNVARIVIEAAWPNTTDQALWIALDPIAVFAVGYWIRDDANVSTPVVVSTPAPTEAV